MKYCTLKPWHILKSDIQMIAYSVGWILIILYTAITLFIGAAAWANFFGPEELPSAPMWAEFIRLSWYFWVPAIMLRLTHMLLCEKN